MIVAEPAAARADAQAMPIDYQKLALPYVRAPEIGARETARRPVIVVGAGPVGLTVAIDLARYGTRVLLLDDDDKLASGSRAICFAKRSLEIWDRLGCGEAITRRGVSWNVGKLYLGDSLVYQFDLLPEPGHHRPAFVNLQQYCVEGLLYDHALAVDGLDMRFRHRVTGVETSDEGVRVDVDTPDGTYTLDCDYLVACDGSHSAVRALLGLETHGQVFRDRFLIADVRMRADLPAERRFWFDPPFHRHGSALMHRQPDNVWRLDFQLGWDADPVAERAPERVIPRVRAMVGDDVDFELVWCSVYTFSCTRMGCFRHGRVLFAGDAAHGVSPFGARGANSGVEDAANLAWKLHYVLHGQASDALLDSYCREREQAADENIRHSTRSADFLTPKSEASRTFRDAVLGLARDHPFARRLVNSGRLSTASTHADSPLNTPDADRFEGAMVPGAPACDAPVMRDGQRDWLLRHLGSRFVAMRFADRGDTPIRHANAPDADGIRVDTLDVAPDASTRAPGDALVDVDGFVASRYDATPGTTYLFRPDQHVCARWRRFDPDAIRAAVSRATSSPPRP
jgi:3-(3-hydroxy-phenyl)propionate hydroxylase